MADFTVKMLMVGMLGTNCSILVNEETKEALIVDPGDEADRIVKEMAGMGGRPVAILLTHAHYDHTMAVGDLLRRFPGLPVVAGAKERVMFEDDSLNCPPYGGVPSVVRPNVWVAEGEELAFAGAGLKVLETPGHTGGSICLFLKAREGEKRSLLRLRTGREELGDAGILFAGDTLFYRSYGRTDFPTGSDEAMWASLQKLLTTLPENTLVIPGHGQITMIGYERRVKGIR